MRPKPFVLAIVSGIDAGDENNPIRRIKMPNWQKLVHEYPAMTLCASGEDVGLFANEPGNISIGYLNIGTGRVSNQTIQQIDKSIVDGSFFNNKILLTGMENAKKKGAGLHLIGLLSTRTDHSVFNHCLSLLEIAAKEKVKNVFVHVILGEGETEGGEILGLIKKLQEKMKQLGVGKIASVSGELYAMGRDRHWDRTEKAYRAIVEGIGDSVADGLEAVSVSYSKNVFDENVVPAVICKNNKAIGMVKEGDSIIFFNHRPDHQRQLLKAIVLPSFSRFMRKELRDLFVITLTEYEKELPVAIAFSLESYPNCLSEMIGNSNLKQLRITESVGFPYLNYYFDGQREELFKGVDEKIISSPLVDSYLEAPKLSVGEITKTALRAIHEEIYDVMVINFMNLELLKNGSDDEKVNKATLYVDKEIGKLADYTLAKDGVMVVVGSNGQAVPFVIIGSKYQGQSALGGDPPEGDLSLLPPVGKLADVAPTILKILEIDQPGEMTGRVLI